MIMKQSDLSDLNLKRCFWEGASKKGEHILSYVERWESNKSFWGEGLKQGGEALKQGDLTV
jgi:hypothetical protein